MGEKNMQLAKLVSACKEYPSPGLVRRKRSPYSITAAAIATVIALAGVAGSSHAAIITVSSLNDDTANGYCDLREAINSANGGAGIGNCTAGTGQDTIVFNITGTITIGSRLPDITKSLAIIGPGTAPGITLDGADKYEVMIVDSDATLNLSQLTIADGNAGVGGILNLGTLTVNDSTFDGNIGNSGGGAIASFGTPTVTNSTFANNGGFDGGGIDNGGTATVTNSSFNGNAASGAGAGIFGPANIKGALFSASTGANCAGGVVVDEGYNLDDDGSCGFSSGITPDAQIKLDPNGLQSNGGPTQTIALESGSAAIDQIPVSDCTGLSNPAALLATDQRGVIRPQGYTCDIGAYEYNTARSLKTAVLKAVNNIAGGNRKDRQALKLAASNLSLAVR
jgi:fibronectin-binding autotransporter adhesin